MRAMVFSVLAALSGALGSLACHDALKAMQAPVLVVGEERHVASDPRGRPLVEPHLSTHPTEAGHLLVGVIAAEADGGSYDCAALASFDGGETWARHDFGHVSCGDPWGVVLDDGTAIMTVLAEEPGAEGQAAEIPHLLVYRSADGGRTWPDPPLSLGRAHDHQTLAIDRTGGESDGTLYVASVQTVRRPEPERFGNALFRARSHDGGRTFETFTSFPTGLDFNAMTPAVLADGRVLVPFSDYARRAPDGSARLEVGRDWIAFSSDGGETLSAPYMITDSCGRSWSELSVDLSAGPHAGRMFYTCNDGSYENIWVHSSDDGLAWSDPTPVNRESGRRPYARTPALEVDSQGVVAITFNDGRGSGSFMHIFRCQRTYVTASADGGETWLTEVPLSSAPSCPVSSGNGTIGMRFPAGGDYHGLAALPGGSFRVVWSDARSGVFELWTNTVEVLGPRP